MTAESARRYVEAQAKDAAAKLSYSPLILPKDVRLKDAFMALSLTSALCDMILEEWDKPDGHNSER